MTDWEVKVCQLCSGLAGLWFRHGKLVVTGEFNRATDLETAIRDMIEDIRSYIEKGEC